jgi:hypothetical protein
MAAIVYDNDFKFWPAGLFCHGIEACVKRHPVVVDRYDNAESRHL